MPLKNKFLISRNWPSKALAFILNIAPYTPTKSFIFRKVSEEIYSEIYDVFVRFEKS